MPRSRPTLPNPARDKFREAVRRRPCPKCHARAGQLCIGPSGPRISNHQERVDLTTGGDTSYWRVKRSRPKRQA